MGYAFVIFGLIMVVTAAKGTHSALGSQLVKDFTGPGNFIYWFVAIGIIGIAARTPATEKIGKPFLALVLTAMLLANRGFFAQFMAAIRQGPIASPRENAAGQSGSAADAASTANTVSSVANAAASLAKVASSVAVLV